MPSYFKYLAHGAKKIGTNKCKRIVKEQADESISHRFHRQPGGRLAEKETDIEPPVEGDILRLDHLTNFADENVYVVFDRSYMALDENHVEVMCALDRHNK